MPGVTLNFSKSGISTTIGPRGASINIGRRGTYLNTGIPGTGLYDRTRLDTPRRKATASPRNAGFPHHSHDIDDAFLADLGFVKLAAELKKAPEGLSSPSQQPFEELVNGVARQAAQLEAASLRWSKRIKGLWWLLGFGVLLSLAKAGFLGLVAVVLGVQLWQYRQRKRLQDAQADLVVPVDVNLGEAAAAAWAKLAQAFDQLRAAERIRDITYSQPSHEGPGNSVTAVPVSLNWAAPPLLSSEIVPLHWENADGGDLYIYPGFVLLQFHQAARVVCLHDVRLDFERIRFIESQPVPADAQVVDHVWAYANKDGSPDRRRRHNWQMPVSLMAELHFVSGTGLNERYQISNGPLAEQFVQAFWDFQEALRLD